LAATLGYDEAPGTAYPNLAIFVATVKSPHTNDELLAAFDRVIEEFRSGPVDRELLEVAKRAIAVEYLQHFRSNMSLALDFISSTLLYDNWRALFDWYDEAMRVTPEDISRVAKLYLRTDNRVVARLERLESQEER
jgi:predicted Zn-dependent peptidase